VHEERKGGRLTAILSVFMHVALAAGGDHVEESPEVIEKSIEAFVISAPSPPINFRVQ
jgi:hypothetical protein